jgi:hypothetical protein
MSSETKRIAIVNPYLQGGHTQTAEIESTARFITAAARLGITAEMKKWLRLIQTLLSPTPIKNLNSPSIPLMVCSPCRLPGCRMYRGLLEIF